jgi:hypothetical protein
MHPIMHALLLVLLAAGCLMTLKSICPLICSVCLVDHVDLMMLAGCRTCWNDQLLLLAKQVLTAGLHGLDHRANSRNTVGRASSIYSLSAEDSINMLAKWLAHYDGKMALRTCA